MFSSATGVNQLTPALPPSDEPHIFGDKTYQITTKRTAAEQSQLARHAHDAP